MLTCPPMPELATTCKGPDRVRCNTPRALAAQPRARSTRAARFVPLVCDTPIALSRVQSGSLPCPGLLGGHRAENDWPVSRRAGPVRVVAASLPCSCPSLWVQPCKASPGRCPLGWRHHLRCCLGERG